MTRRRFLNHFVARTPDGAIIVVREWQAVRESTTGDEVDGEIWLETECSKSVRFDAPVGRFTLADGTPLTTSDPGAELTRRRMTRVN